MADNTLIPIIKGDDTNFVDDQFIIIKFNTDIDFTGFIAKFTLGETTLTYNEIKNKEINVVLNNAFTSNLKTGKQQGELKLIDSNSRIRTITSVIPFIVMDKVKTSPTYVNNVLEFVTEINNTSIEITIETAGIAKSEAEEYVATMESLKVTTEQSSNLASTNAQQAALSEENAKLYSEMAETAQSNASSSATIAQTASEDALEYRNEARTYAEKAAEKEVQSNWEENNNLSKAYIQNKPTVLSDFKDDITTQLKEDIINQFTEAIQTGTINKANRNLDNIDWNNLDQRAKDSLGATIKTYNNVVYGVAKTIAFNGDYSTFSAVDISSYADGTYRVFAKTSSAIIPKTYTEGATAPTNPSVGDVWKYIPAEPAEGEEQTETECYKEYVTVTVPATEEGAEDTITNEWQVVELTELAKIKTADGMLSEVLSSVQYSTAEPLQEVDLHTETSYADSIGQVQTGKLSLIPFNFVNPNWSDYVAVTANTECKYSRDGVFYPTAVAKIVLTEADGTVTEFPAKLELKLKAGDKFTSTVAGKFYFYY